MHDLLYLCTHLSLSDPGREFVEGYSCVLVKENALLKFHLSRNIINHQLHYVGDFLNSILGKYLLRYVMLFHLLNGPLVLCLSMKILCNHLFVDSIINSMAHLLYNFIPQELPISVQLCSLVNCLCY